jgi:ADP-ribose pyrophosphatase YjhB (NUDIX family)
VGTPRVRPKVVCVCRRGDQILVGAGFDSVKQQTFYGPLGGEVEFGERASEAASREMREELGVEIADLRLLGVLENIFTYEGEPGHEIVFIYDARLADTSLYEEEELAGEESNGQRFLARWMPLRMFSEGGPPLYPDGLYELLSSGAADEVPT